MEKQPHPEDNFLKLGLAPHGFAVFFYFIDLSIVKQSKLIYAVLSLFHDG